MGFTRKFLSALGVEPDKVDEIISAHNEVLEHFKSENAELKEKVLKFDEIKTRLADTEKTLKETSEKLKTAETERDDFRAKHDTLKSEKEKLESEISAKEIAVRKDKALSEMLRSKNYSDEAVKLIVNKGGYRDKIELDKDGKAKNIDNLFSDIQTDFSMLVPKESVSDGSPAKPPSVVKLAEDIQTWKDKYSDVVNSPYTSESFKGYSYSKASGNGANSGGATGVTWRSVFADSLGRWRKI